MSTHPPPSLETPESVKGFNLWATWIMARLWEHFPHPQYFNLTPTSVSVQMSPHMTGEPFGPAQGAEACVLFLHTMSWLMEENFIRGKGNGHGSFAQVTLASKGFSVLSEAPRALGDKSSGHAKSMSLGKMLCDAVAMKAVDAMAALIVSMNGLPRSS